MSLRREEAYQKIRSAILNGELGPGERVIGKDVCEKYQIGRTPLRETLCQLEAEGYLDVISNKGAVVRKLSIKDAEHIFEIVALLEGYATETAVRYYITPEDRNELRAIQNACKEAGRARDHKGWLERNALFHGYFPRLTGNVHLCHQIEDLRRRVHRYRLIAATMPGGFEKHVGAHETVLKAVANNDPGQAGKAMRKHVLYVKNMLSDVLKQYPGL